MKTGIVKADQIAPDPARDIQVVICKNVQDPQTLDLNNVLRKILISLKEDITNGFHILKPHENVNLIACQKGKDSTIGMKKW